MRRSRLPSLDGKQFPLTLADCLRAAFADFVSEPIPQNLATLLSRFEAGDVRWIEPETDRGQRQAA